MTTVLDSLNAGLYQAFASDERVYLLGEDVLDPYGGAFKVSRGLSSTYPGRVLTTPISEAGFTGLAAGMALRGLRPVVEIMFGDFVTLAADQLINHIAKFSWMYGGNKPIQEQPHVPLLVRTPMGGRRGYGPTHSQTLEKLFLGIPGLRVQAPAPFQEAGEGAMPPGSPGDILCRSILENTDPTLFIENKLLYLLPVLGPEQLEDFTLRADQDPWTYTLAVRGAPPPQVTIAAYGYMTELARQAMRQLAYESELFTELVVPTQLSPFEIEPILASVRKTGRLVTVEEGTFSLGWGAEIIARASEVLGSQLHSARRVAARELPVPASGPLERAVLPGVAEIVAAISAA